jgi:hypothetical protein
MSWGAAFFYYRCPACGKKFKYGADAIAEFGPQFGLCPGCGVPGDYLFDGPRPPEDMDYEEVDEVIRFERGPLDA